MFTSEDVPTGQLKKWHDDDAVKEQVIMFANRGFFHGTQSESATNDLLWWKLRKTSLGCLQVSDER